MEEPSMSDVPVEVCGEGEPIILLHGSGAPAPVSETTWAKQRPLAERYRLIMPTRRGYGERPVVMQTDIESDVADLLSLLGEGAHLLGFSYGGIVALTAAARRPDLVRSLTVIEPPALKLAHGSAEAAAQMARLSRFEPPPPDCTPEDFWRYFRRLMGLPVPEQVTLSPVERKAVEAHMAEAPPFTLDIPLDALEKTAFPKLVVSGDWNPAMDAIADVLTERLHTERFVLRGWYHNVHRAGAPFNHRLEMFLQAAQRP
jgi:pimeloyl-ACP methyl ester carboxylesterase